MHRLLLIFGIETRKNKRSMFATKAMKCYASSIEYKRDQGGKAQLRDAVPTEVYIPRIDLKA